MGMLFNKSQDILFESFDRRTLVFDLKKHLPYDLNEIASYIFLKTDGNTHQEKIAEKVCEKYDVGSYKALIDIKALYKDLHQKGIIESVEE
jgi:hypothetical protein